MKSNLSKAIPHFAQFRFQDGKKHLWNPILKKKFKNRPEERVRLELVEYLTLETGFPSQRIAFESPLKLQRDSFSSRADLIAYDDKYKPLLLVEVKARSVTTSQITALQAARYQQVVKAPYILLTNGTLDYWFDMEEALTQKGSIDPMEEVPQIFQPQRLVVRDLDYWQSRGFAGGSSHERTNEFLLRSCSSLFVDPDHYVLFPKFDITAPNHYLENYYAFLPLEADYNVAVAFTATPAGYTLLNIILSKGVVSQSFLSVSLDRVADGESFNCEVYTGQKEIKLDIRAAIDFHLSGNVMDFIASFKELLLQLSK